MRFYHAGQAGLELQTSGDPPASASQNAGITGVSHHIWRPCFKEQEPIGEHPDSLHLGHDKNQDPTWPQPAAGLLQACFPLQPKPC